MLFFGSGLGTSNELTPLTSEDRAAVNYIREHLRDRTWGAIYREMVPGYPSLAASRAYQAKAFAAQRALAANLPECPASSITGQSCYYGRFVPVTQGPDNTWGLLAPGAFDIYGVVFNAGEYSNGRFQRAYKPTSWQRQQAELAVIRASQRLLFGPQGLRPGDQPNEWFVDGSPRPIIGNAALNEYRKAAGISVSTAENLSVGAMLAIAPQMTLRLNNFERNPIPPTDTEMTAKGGWRNWLMRGGYPLVKNVVKATLPLNEDAMSPQFCASIACRCSSGNGPACVPAVFNKDGIGGRPSEGAFWVYLAISQDPNNPYFELSLVHADPSFVTRIGNAGAELIQKIGAMYCGDPKAAQQTQALLKDSCVDANNQVCAKGSPGCTCTPPPAASQASVTGWNLLMKKGCASWVTENTPPPPFEPPIQNPPPSLPPPGYVKKTLPWWVIVAGGLIAGGAIFSKR